MNLKIFIFLAGCSFKLIAQLPVRPYEKLIFNENKPIWYNVAFEESLINDDCDGYNNLYDWTEVDPIVVDNFIYTALEIRTKENVTEGAYIEKRNLQTGELGWKIIYDTKVLDSQEIPFKMYVGENNYLYVHGFRIRNDDVSEWPFLTIPRKNCLLTYRKINTLTGEIEEFYTPQESSQSAAVVSASNERNNLYGNLFLTNNSNEFVYWERRIPPISNPKQIIHFFKVDKFGNRLNDIDSVTLGPINVVINLMQLSKDTILYLECNVEKQEIVLYFLNINFEILGSILLDKFPSQIQNNRMFANLVEENFLFLRSIVFNGQSFSELTGLYNLDGSLLDYLELNNTINISYTAQVNRKEKKIIGMKEGFDSDLVKPIMEVFQSVGNNTLEITDSFQLGDSLRIGKLQRLHFINENRVLFQFYETSIYLGTSLFYYDNNARANSFALFDVDDIGLGPVSVSDVEDQFDFTLYPNPAYDLVTVKTEELMDGIINVYDNVGKQVINERFKNQNMISIPIDQLVSGMYLVRIQNNQKGVLEKRFVKL